MKSSVFTPSSLRQSTLGFSLLALASTGAFAADPTYPAIVHAADGSVVHNAYGECWGTGPNDMSATPTTECGQGAPKVEAAPAPVVHPAPVVAEPVPHAAPAAPAKVTLSSDALFDFNKAILKPAGKQRIDEELASFDHSSGLINLQSVKVIGYTDSIGSAKYNLKLSQSRAQAVKDFLVSKGIPAERISAEGRGETDPVASNKTKDGRAQNRRAEIVFAN